ncbi:MAG: hypothetical protein R2867_39755 [Caldilineaceae bacterium]
MAYNDICVAISRLSMGLSVYGRSPNGKIHHNRIYLNSAYDEGGGVMIAGELPADPNVLSPGSGSVDIYDNLIQPTWPMMTAAVCASSWPVVTVAQMQ